MTFGAFATAAMLRKDGIKEMRSRTSRVVQTPPSSGAFMLIFMVSLAGIPTAGFIGKFYVFMSAVEAGMTGWRSSR